ncbi:MAG: radical SAM protein [Gemmatimonadota bacterium]|nr:radical SAM protein [Gemmatimonadota bacterium]
MGTTAQLPLLDGQSSNRPVAQPLLLLAEQPARGASFLEVPVKAILNGPASTGMGFWSLNPYVGCEFGCTYCYARETHKWRMETIRRLDGLAVGRLGGLAAEATAAVVAPSSADNPTALPPNRPTALPPWEAFEKQIMVKTSAAAVLQRTLFPAKLAGCALVIGTATDPYQPAERQFQLTRSILEALLSWRGLTLGIITKSPLILRDVDLLRQLAERHELSVNISLASTDAALLREVEARSPAPHTRLRALKGLTDAGIHAGLLIAPILPGITDSTESLAALMAAGKAAGARYVHGSALRLGPAARSRFLPHLAHAFPGLVERYRQRYGAGASVGREYTDALSRRLQRLQQEYGFPVHESRKQRARLEGRMPGRETSDEAAAQGTLSL